jgi:hypothetical protein
MTDDPELPDQEPDWTKSEHAWEIPKEWLDADILLDVTGGDGSLSAPMNRKQRRARAKTAAPKTVHRKRCRDCGTNWADPPSPLCPGCDAYQEHQR